MLQYYLRNQQHSIVSTVANLLFCSPTAEASGVGSGLDFLFALSIGEKNPSFLETINNKLQFTKAISANLSPRIQCGVNAPEYFSSLNGVRL